MLESHLTVGILSEAGQQIPRPCRPSSPDFL